MTHWLNHAFKLLRESLSRNHELNELDWKLKLTSKDKKTAIALSAFSNLSTGGFLVFGVSDNGVLEGVTKGDIENITSDLGRISQHNLSPAIRISHQAAIFDGVNLLFVYVPSCKEKPVYLKSGSILDSYIRHLSSNRKMSRDEIRKAIVESGTISFEEIIAQRQLSDSDVGQMLFWEQYMKVAHPKVPLRFKESLRLMEQDGLLLKSGDRYDITNLGAILFAKDFSFFDSLSRKAVRVVKYKGRSKDEIERQRDGSVGYAVGFPGLNNFLNGLLPVEERIQGDGKRHTYEHYPKEAVREFLANALIHQDFMETGASPFIEIFEDRLVITNPGAPLIRPLKFVNAPPKSRNQKLARLMRLYGFCEEQGSGVGRAFSAIETGFLPAPSIEVVEGQTQVVMYGPKKFQNMTKEERIRACYWHCFLNWKNQIETNNASLRKRLGLPESKSSTVSALFSETMEKTGYIKISRDSGKSRKYQSYVPFWVLQDDEEPDYF